MSVTLCLTIRSFINHFWVRARPKTNYVNKYIIVQIIMVNHKSTDKRIKRSSEFFDTYDIIFYFDYFFFLLVFLTFVCRVVAKYSLILFWFFRCCCFCGLFHFIHGERNKDEKRERKRLRVAGCRFLLHEVINLFGVIKILHKKKKKNNTITLSIFFLMNRTKN